MQADNAPTAAPAEAIAANSPAVDEAFVRAVATAVLAGLQPMIDRLADRPAPEAVDDCVGADQFAAALGVSVRTFWRMHEAGDLPEPVRIPGVRRTRWRRRDAAKFVVECGGNVATLNTVKEK